MNELKGFEPVAEVMWYEPLLHDEKGCGRKIIDASMEFMDAVPLGTKLYTAAQLAAVVQQRDELLAALQKIADADPSEGGCYYTNKTNINTAKRAIAKVQS